MPPTAAVAALPDDFTAAFTDLLDDVGPLDDAADVERFLSLGVLPLDDPELPDGPITAVLAALEQQGAAPRRCSPRPKRA